MQLLNHLAIDHRRVEAADVAGVEPGELEPIDQEEAAEPDVLAVERPTSAPMMSKASCGAPWASMPTSPCRWTSKNPIVIQTAYWCVRTVVRFIAFWSAPSASRDAGGRR